MSDLYTLMEEHCDQERYPSLVKLCTAQKDAVKTFISNFETVESAKANLQYKMKLAFKNSRGRKKRGPGLDVDLNLLYTEAKATTKITATGWRTLETAVSVTGDTYMAGQHGISEDAHDGHDDDDDDEHSLPQRFNAYKNASREMSRKQGFYVDGHLQEILSLSDVLFMKENESSRQQISYFGLAELDHLHNAIVSKCMDPSVKFSTSLYNDISAILRDFRPQHDGTRSTKEKLNDLAKNADDDDYKLIGILINCLNKLPLFTRLNEEVGEAELQGNYIDPIMYPMFHNPQESRYFRWLNKQVTDTSIRRPDGNMYKMEQREFGCSVGFVEVKAERSESVKRHEDMIRLVVFCKDAMEKQSTKAMIAVQVVGFYISFYLFISMDDIYVMVELYSFETAKYLGQLPHLLSMFDNLKRIMICSKEHCVTIAEDGKRRRNSSLDKEELDRFINTKKPKSVSPSLSFRK
ncbi:hypothetical protein RO3G_14904 [Lichtheimia corymbifera JMRC:FSU:9682]|uniref:Uncharacterized protein n=1 Tax=Lichtheimia corymbifera JMRC:FSU:9682 TaxID=1263082 RepID=A0A068S3D8_9FUNG|nr:hypothetical protein RO3G_14904 [Lichtheimia corymbifera JMRC:FSU:9682]